jgi:hypothetical protein
MREALQALNALVERGVIQTYAIGGAIGASFYIDAVQTEDIDAFVHFPSSTSGLLSLTPIYSALTDLGGKVEREYIRFGEWPLQVLPDVSPLVHLAIREAVTVDFDGIPTRVFRPEHLCCIALETGRAKDILRVRMFLEQQKVDETVLRKVAQQFGLADKLSKAEAL